jgi:hypothetical protein
MLLDFRIVVLVSDVQMKTNRGLGVLACESEKRPLAADAAQVFCSTMLELGLAVSVAAVRASVLLIVRL